MNGKILQGDFSQRAKDLRYMKRIELEPERKWSRQEMRIARAIERSNVKQ